MSENFMVQSELAQIFELLKVLNTISMPDISVGAVNIYDANGEAMSHIKMCEGGEYALYPGKADYADN